jgi:serine/threonine protein kinase/WD40 repeat protein
MNESQIFAEALKRGNVAERQAYLDGACGNNAELRNQVEGLLKSANQNDSFLEHPAANLELTVDHAVNLANDLKPIPEDKSGTMIGCYKLLQKIGEGGMGTVWMAEQQEPVRRMIALKLVKVGMDSSSVIARFEAERQALALMDHPNIARIFDAGIIGQRPYFVMELVKGKPITKYCDELRLAPQQRLELFVHVCHAIQHAHQKGIIHRDIKPSNVLVAPYDGRPVVKIIDFGVAKATGQRLTDKTMFTEFGAVVGTLEYMSPEQAELNNQDIDTRSDIYALGVLIYELLTGSTPLDRKSLKVQAMLEMLRMIREEEPPKPSTRLSTDAALPSISEQRQTDPAKLTKLMKGELDWIIMKSLDKDRNRRYETANGLAKDIQNYLAGETVEACPPTLGYRLRKAYRKNKTAVGVVTAFVLILMTSAAASSILALKARRAEEMASAARDAALVAEKTAELEKENALNSRDQLQNALYASDMQMAASAWKDKQRSRMLDLLNRQIPQPGQADLRAFEWHFLDRQCHQSKRLLELPEGPKTITADGTRVYLRAFTENPSNGTRRYYFRIWDLISGKELPEYEPFPGENCKFLTLQSLNAKGNRAIAYAQIPGKENPAELVVIRKVVDLESRKDLFLLPISKVDESVTVSMGGNDEWLVMQPNQNPNKVPQSSITVWNLVERKVVRTISLADKEFFASASSAIDPNAARFTAIVSVVTPAPGAFNEMRTWDLQTGKELWRVPVEGTFISSLRYSPDGKFLAQAPYDQQVINLRNPANGELIHKLILPGPNTTMSQKLMHFNMDSSKLASSLPNMSGISVWEIPAAPTHQDIQPFKTFSSDARVARTAFGADGQSLIVASSEPAVESFELGARNTLYPGPKGGRLYVVSGVGPNTGRSWAIWQFPDANQPTYEFRVWDFTGRVLLAKRVNSLANSMDDWFSCSLTPDGKKFIHTQSYTHLSDATNDRAIICLWDVESQAELSRNELPGGRIQLGAIHPDGRHIAMARKRQARPLSNRGPYRTRLSLWNLIDNKEKYGEDIDGYVIGAAGADFSSDGTRVAWSLGFGNQEATTELRVWDVTNQKILWKRNDWNNRVFNNLERPVFSHDCRFVLVSKNDFATTNELFVLDAQTGRELRPAITSPSGNLQHLRITPDGKRMFALTTTSQTFPPSFDSAVVWDLVNGREMLNIPLTSVWAMSLDRVGQQLRILKSLPGSSDLTLETFDATPRSHASK